MQNKDNTYVTDETPLSAVALMMLDKKVSSVTLCDQDHNAVGVITSDDLLYQFSQMMKKVESKKQGETAEIDYVLGAGEFFKRLSDIGI